MTVINFDDIAKRLAQIERRLAQLEAMSGSPAPPAAEAAPAARPSPARAPAPAATKGPSAVTSLLGWGGAIALVLAAAYLIRYAIDTGWLTPMRQICFAAVFGLVLIGAGFLLRESEREYAGLLPAAGVVVLFLTTYGAHLYYGLIGAAPAAAAVIGLSAASLILCRVFESDLYALFAVAGSYSAPLLLPALRGSVLDIAIYFTAWGAVFSVFAIWHGRRLIYLLALYMGLIGFDYLWQRQPPDQWIAAVVFQTAQFVMFGVATAVFSIRRKAPLTREAAIAHLPPLLLFYFLQYVLLDKHLPDLAPWIAAASLAVLALLYAAARNALRRPLPGGELLLWGYVALVLFHAGYVQSVPLAWAPWVGCLLVPVLAVVILRGSNALAHRWPVALALAIIFAVNYLRVVFDTEVASVPGRSLLAVAYAALLYVAYAFSRDRAELRAAGVLALYMAHISAMGAAIHLIHEPIVESAAWGVIALACLGLSLWKRDRLLGQSSLLVFALAAGKVLLFDLSGASPLARITSLVVLGVSFYLGGMLYQRMIGAAAKT